MSSLNFNDPLIEKMVKVRIKMLFNKPFFGQLATRLDLVDATKWCKTVATDGRNFYYNRDFIKQLDEEELHFVFGHEVLHMAYDHLGRRGGRDPELHAMACDYVANYTLKKEGVGKAPKENVLYDDRFTDEMTSEEVYRILEKNKVDIKIPLDEHLELGQGEGEGESGDSNGNSITVSVMGGPDGPPQLTEEDLAKIRNSVKASIIAAAQSVGAGNVPAGIARMIDSFTNPLMDWRTLLEMHIQSSVKDDFTFQRPSRRSWTTGCLLPGQDFKDSVSVAVAIDTSGSMTDEMLRDFLSEVKGIMETFDDFELWLWTFDTRVYNPKKFTPNNLDEIYHYIPQGGGGTYFKSNWDFMKNPSEVDPEFELDELVPAKFVMFTDGYDSGDCGKSDEDWCDTLFIIHGRDNFEPGFGITAYYDKRN